jgi:hypothetical protein
MVAVAVIAVAAVVPVSTQPSAADDSAGSGAYDCAHWATNNRTGCTPNHSATHGASLGCRCGRGEGNGGGQSNDRNGNSDEKSPKSCRWSK